MASMPQTEALSPSWSLGRISNPTPAKPTATPSAFRQVMRSSCVSRCASRIVKIGVVDCSNAAQPLGMYCSPQEIIAKGSAPLSKPITAKAAHILRGRGASVFRDRRMIHISRAARPSRPATSVSGPISLTMILMKRYDVPQMEPRINSRSRFICPFFHSPFLILRVASTMPPRITPPPRMVDGVGGSLSTNQARKVEPMGSASTTNDT